MTDFLKFVMVYLMFEVLTLKIVHFENIFSINWYSFNDILMEKSVNY